MELAFLAEASIHYPVLIAFVIAATALAISPGPDNIFVLTQSISKGSRAGLATACGLVVGCLVHTSLLAFGVSEIIKRSEPLFFGIKLFGSLYLLFLALKVFKGDDRILLNGKREASRSPYRLFLTGFAMNVLNPKVAIFFLAFFPGFLFSETLGTVVQFYVLGLLFMICALLVFGTIALLAGQISKYIKVRPKAGLWLKWIQITVLVGIAIYLLLSGK